MHLDHISHNSKARLTHQAEGVQKAAAACTACGSRLASFALHCAGYLKHRKAALPVLILSHTESCFNLQLVGEVSCSTCAITGCLFLLLLSRRGCGNGSVGINLGAKNRAGKKKSTGFSILQPVLLDGNWEQLRSVISEGHAALKLPQNNKGFPLFQPR